MPINSCWIRNTALDSVHFKLVSRKSSFTIDYFHYLLNLHYLLAQNKIATSVAFLSGTARFLEMSMNFFYFHGKQTLETKFFFQS